MKSTKAFAKESVVAEALFLGEDSVFLGAFREANIVVESGET